MSSKNYRYKHIYSAVEDKAPSASTLMTGEIAVNGNAEKPQLFIKDTSGDVRSFYSDYFQEVTQAQYDQMVEEGTIDERIMYIISDATPIDVSKYVSSGSVDTTASTSAFTLSFSGDNGNIFDLEIPKGEGKTYSAGTSITIDSANTISVVVDDALDSGSTNPVANSALTEALDNKLDKVNFINNLYPKGSVYITYENKNPSEFLGGTWELIGGQDENLVFYPAFAIDTDSAGTTINESLPNITGKFTAYDYAGGWHDGATSTRQTLNPNANAGGSETPWIGYTFNASTSNSTYQDGAHVNVNAIKLFHWRRTDDGTIVEQITPLDVDVEDVLWEGSTSTSGDFTLSNSIGDYKYLKFYTTDHAASVNRMVDRVDVKDINTSSSSAVVIIENAWDSTLRYCTMYKLSDTSLHLSLQSETLLKITGVRAVPTSDATAEVTDVLWEGTSATEASVSLPMAKSLFGYKEIVLIVTNSDDWNQNTQAKSLTLSDYNRIVEAGGTALISFDWDGTSRFVNGIQYLNDGMTFKAWVSGCKIRKIIGIKRYSAIDITAGDGINISEGGVISSTVTFKNYYVNINMTTQGNFSGTITCDSGFVPLGLGSTSIRTDGAVGYGYCDNIVKVSDTQYRFSGWANPNGTSGSGASSITVYATFVKNATVLNNY